jgi:CubicO group peptidase (beta-lactamase class C family)
MSMTSGLDYKHHPTGHAIYQSPDTFAYALSPGFIADPGRRFLYSDGDASIAGAAIAAVAHTDLLSLATAVLFRPLGFKNFDWWFRDAAGRYPGGWGLRLRVVDMVKLGQLYLDKGRWQDREIVAPGFVDLVWKKSSVPFYGLYWWRFADWIASPEPIYTALGFKGQRVFVLPRLRMVVAVTANLSSPDEKTVYVPILKKIVAAARGEKGPVAPAPEDEKELAEELAMPFKGKPGTAVRDQDIPRLAGASAR